MRQAKQIEARLLEEVGAGRHKGSRSRTMAELLERWLEWRPTVRPIAPTTVASYRAAMDLRPQFTSPDWGPVPLQIVVRGVYSPCHPNGDPKVVSAASMTFNVSGTATSKGALLRFKPPAAERSTTSAATVDLVRYGSIRESARRVRNGQAASVGC